MTKILFNINGYSKHESDRTKRVSGIRNISLITLVAMFLFTFFSLQAPIAQADNAVNNDAAKLNNIITQISAVKTDLTNKKQKHSSVKEQLKSLEKKIVVFKLNLKNTTQNLKIKKNILAKLTKDQIKQEVQLKDAQKKLSSQINLAYKIPHRSRFKDIVNADANNSDNDSDSGSKHSNMHNKQPKISPVLLMTYHKYIFMARLEQMHNINKTLKRLEQNKRTINQQTKELEKLEIKQKQQKLELETTKKERDALLKSLKIKIAAQSNKLTQLLLAKKNLEQLIDRLTLSKGMAMSHSQKNRFCQNFVWPTKGEVVIRFGSAIEDSSWRWNGLIISAPEGQDVRAISSGRVIYANWLSGYGLLLIIDHGNGYMSLYGHNNKIHKKINAKVAAGEVVACVGKTGCEESRLYFAIRHNGKPIDPEKWCQITKGVKS